MYLYLDWLFNTLLSIEDQDNIISFSYLWFCEFEDWIFMSLIWFINGGRFWNEIFQEFEVRNDNFWMRLVGFFLSIVY